MSIAARPRKVQRRPGFELIVLGGVADGHRWAWSLWVRLAVTWLLDRGKYADARKRMRAVERAETLAYNREQLEFRDSLVPFVQKRGS